MALVKMGRGAACRFSLSCKRDVGPSHFGAWRNCIVEQDFASMRGDEERKQGVGADPPDKQPITRIILREVFFV